MWRPRRDATRRDATEEIITFGMFEHHCMIVRSMRFVSGHRFSVAANAYRVLITVSAEMTVEKAVQLIKGSFAFRARREFGFRARVWPKGFSEVRVNE
jgi:hypothetical protein